MDNQIANIWKQFGPTWIEWRIKYIASRPDNDEIKHNLFPTEAIPLIQDYLRTHPGSPYIEILEQGLKYLRESGKEA